VSDISPEKLALLKQVVDLQELQLKACTQIFRGLSDHSDPEVSCVSKVSAEALTETAAVIDALIDRLTATIPLMGRRSTEQKALHAAEERARRQRVPSTDEDKAKKSAYDRSHYTANKAAFNQRSRTYQLRSKYGITEKIQQELIAAQGHQCAICRTDKPGGRGSWHTDHCHTSGVVRGMLCL